MKRVLAEVASNWKAGLTVALVSVPLSLSLAIASGATPIMGIITAIWAGLVAAALGGSNFNVIGPAGALSGILMSFTLTHGAQMLPMIAILSGLLIFAFYLLRWDKYLVFIPSSVMHGFTLGVGLTIALGQLNFALGLSGLPSHESLFLNVMESFRHVAETQAPVFILFAALLALLFLLARLFPRVPGAVIVAAIGILLGYLSEVHRIPFTFPTLLSKYGVFHAVLIQPPQFLFPLFDLTLLKVVLTVTVVAVLETLLSAKIVDGMTGTRFDQKREMFGLSLANIASGLAGGLPATGVLARTALNARSGATSRWASGINAVFVLLIALVLFRGFQYMPLAAVASILVFAAIRMVEVKHFVKLVRFDYASFWLSMVVGVLTFAVDPMVGILVGATVSLLAFARHLSRGQSELTLHKDRKMLARIPHHKLSDMDDHGDVVVYRLAGELTYFNAKAHEDAIHKIRAGTIILSLRNLFYIDLDGLELLHEIIEHLEKEGRTILITGAGEFIRPLLHKTHWFADREKDGSVFASTSDALTSLGFHLTA
ncbi:SulP family inorganic anion transporter [Candidatus Uhrbacteria bacterium]|nr:SulP family inorganic anion transporter [Candidatus Uhrbacteria bacterium]